MNAFVYIKSEPSLWTVGFYDTSGDWQPESDHRNQEKAAERTRFLNGGNEKPDIAAIESIAAEFGYICCEKGMNLQMMLENLSAVRKGGAK